MKLCLATHCVLILTLITLTLLLINSALSLADSVADDVQYSNQLTNQFKKASAVFPEDSNHYSAAISGTSNPSPDQSFNSFNPPADRTNDKFADRTSRVNEDDQLNNWDNVYDNSYVNSNSNPPGSAGSPPLEESPPPPLVAKESRDETGAKPNGPTTKAVQPPLNRRYMACSRDFGNITVKNKTAGDNGFKIKITGNSEKYTPGELYTSKFDQFQFFFNFFKL